MSADSSSFTTPVPPQGFSHSRRFRWLPRKAWSRALLIVCLLLLIMIGASAIWLAPILQNAGHQPGDTITHPMPGGGSARLTLASVVINQPVPGANDPETLVTSVSIVNSTSTPLHITPVEFQLTIHAMSPSDAGAAGVAYLSVYPLGATTTSIDIQPGDSAQLTIEFHIPPHADAPRLYWTPDGAGDTSDCWWTLTPTTIFGVQLG